MKFLELLSGLYKSFYSQKFYRNVAANWRARSFLYLFILLAICWFCVVIVVSGRINQVLSTSIVSFSEQMPAIHIEKGTASSDQKAPILIHLPVSEELFMVVDTQGQYKTFDKSDARVLITKNAILVKESKNKTTSYRYSSMLDGTYGPKEFQMMSAKIMKWVAPAFWVAVYVFGLIGIYIFRVIQALFYALIGLIFVALMKRRLDYVALLNLSLVAITPAIVLCSMATLLSLRFSPFYEYPIYFLISMLYLIYAIYANPIKTES